MVWIKCEKCGFNVGNLTAKGNLRCCKCGFENTKNKEEKNKEETK